VGALATWSRVEGAQLPRVRGARRTGGLEHRVDLPGLASIIPVPGFADDQVAFALMDNGSALLLDLADDHARVAGTFTGPIGQLDEGDAWAIASTPDRVTAFKVTRGDTWASKPWE
jgi:hypothetical protein